MKLTNKKGVLPTDSTQQNIKHVYLCDNVNCGKIFFRKSLVKVRGVNVCPVCGTSVTDITFTELGRRYAQS